MLRSNCTWKLLKAEGIEATKYLQGQIAIDVQNLPTLSSSMGFWANHTGKVFASYRLIKINDELYYFLSNGEENHALLRDNLKKFSVFSKVTFSEVEDFNLAFATKLSTQNVDEQFIQQSDVEVFQWGEDLLQSFTLNARTNLITAAVNDSEYFEPNPDFNKVALDYAYPEGFNPTPVAVQQIKPNTYCISSCQTLLVLCIANQTETEQSEQNSTDNQQTTTCQNLEVWLLEQGYSLINSTEFLNLNYLHNCLYKIPASLSGEYLPQAYGLDQVEAAVNYKKGCYQGQEGIARARFRGSCPHIPQTFIADIACKSTKPFLKPNLKCYLEVDLGSTTKESGEIVSFELIKEQIIDLSKFNKFQVESEPLVKEPSDKTIIDELAEFDPKLEEAKQSLKDDPGFWYPSNKSSNFWKHVEEEQIESEVERLVTNDTSHFYKLVLSSILSKKLPASEYKYKLVFYCEREESVVCDLEQGFEGQNPKAAEEAKLATSAFAVISATTEKQKTQQQSNISSTDSNSNSELTKTNSAEKDPESADDSSTETKTKIVREVICKVALTPVFLKSKLKEKDQDSPPTINS